MLLNLLGVLVLLVVSASYILYSTIQIQTTVNASFERQRTLRTVQGELADFQRLLLDYLSTKSSNALSALLIQSQKIAALVPDIPPSFDPVKQREKELYSLIGVYLGDSGRAIDAKRSLNVDGYTRIFSEMEALFASINDEMASMASARFNAQLSDYEQFLAISRDAQFWNLLFIIFISLASLILIFHAVEKINRPLVTLSAAAKEVASGNFDVPDVATTSLVEIDRVVEAFNRMKHDIHRFVAEVQRQRVVEHGYLQERVKNLKMEEMLQRMELFTLQAQMNPHFLFNTLNTGIQLAIVENADRTGQYMEQLTRLFRHNLHEQSVVVKLRHEIEGLESYFYILGVRFPKNLDLVLDASAVATDLYTVPSYILQPLVENCVVHGFTVPHRRNSIVVRATLDDTTLVLSVADNGVGIPGDKVEGLLRVSTADEPYSKVMGLENVIRRLRFFFPNDPEVVSIRTAPGEGTEVLIRIDTRKELCIPS
jgi:two-component system sensor histidine kinase YesM